MTKLAIAGTVYCRAQGIQLLSIFEPKVLLTKRYSAPQRVTINSGGYRHRFKFIIKMGDNLYNKYVNMSK